MSGGDGEAEERQSGGRDGGDNEDARRLIVDGALKSAEGNSNLAVGAKFLLG